MYDTARPFIASYVIFRKDGKMAFVLRSNTKWMNGYYGLPSGKVEQNEPFLAAAIREAKEEVGVDVEPSSLRPALTVHRQEPGEMGNEWVDMYFEASEWKGELHNAEPHMHSEVAWLDPNNLPENVIPSVKAALEHIQAGDTYFEYGWVQD